MFINNRALTFLHHGENAKALDFLKSGLVLLKKLVKTIGWDVEKQESSKLEIDEFANHILRKHAGQRNSDPRASTKMACTTQFRLFQITTTEDPAAAALKLIRASMVCNTRALCCIRFESTESNYTSVYTENPDLMGAILMYNYAVIVILKADQKSMAAKGVQHSSIQQLNESGLRILELCENSILPKLLRTPIEQLSPSTLLLCVVTVHAMLELSRVLHLPCLERHYSSKLAHLCKIICTIQSILPSLHDAAAATA